MLFDPLYLILAELTRNEFEKHLEQLAAGHHAGTSSKWGARALRINSRARCSRLLTADTLSLKGDEIYEIIGLPKMLADKLAAGRKLKVRAVAADNESKEFEAIVRIDTPQEILYYEHGGILQYVLRQLRAGK